MWECKKCGANNSGNSSYCPYCGTKRGETRKKQGANIKYVFVATISAAVICGIVFAANSSQEYPSLPAEATEYVAAMPSSTPTSTPALEQTPLPTPQLTPHPTLEPPAPELTQKKTPSVDDLKALQGNAKYPNNITFPQSSSYLPSYETMYVKTSRGHSAYVYWAPTDDVDHRRNHYVYEGDTVTVVAREKGYSCIIWTSEGISFDGWIPSELLVYEY